MGAITAITMITAAPLMAGPGSDRLNANETLRTDQFIQSTGSRVIMQGDGNLVEYDSTGVVVWASHTAGNPGARAAMQSDGNFVVYSAGGGVLWATNTLGKTGAYITIQRDGHFVMYHNGGAVWWTGRYAYNRVEAVWYQDHYCGAGLCPESRNPNYVYFSNSNDCTNFVSQTLRAGFKRQFGNPTYDAVNRRFWWDYTHQEYPAFWPHPQLSQSASVSFKLYDFLVVYSGYGTPTAGFWLGPAPEPAPAGPPGIENGDLIFYDWQSDGPIDHVNMVVGTGFSAYDGWYGDFVNSHTTNRYHIQWTLTERNSQWQTTSAVSVHINN